MAMELELTASMADACSSAERNEDKRWESVGEREREQRVNEGALVLHIEARRGQGTWQWRWGPQLVHGDHAPISTNRWWATK